MTEYRIKEHPILTPQTELPVKFSWQGESLTAQPGEMIASALFAHGIRIFGQHHKDGAPQGIYCANGQCSQCMVLADGKPVKACMTPVKRGMQVEPLESLPELPPVSPQELKTPFETVETVTVPVLILGGGPAGMSAAIQLGEYGVETLLVDDKDRLGGKLVLQTHRFFGSQEAVYAGTRGIDIATRLEAQVREHESVTIWLESTALAVFSDQLVGILHREQESEKYVLVKPEVVLVATGAREKSLVFKGNTLPGVYGAGAFQTLVNRDLVQSAERLFIVGGGNVGLIAGYHALQAGIEVVGLVEALPQCGGYKVHRDKLARLGVPIYTSHTILSANGEQEVESVTVAEIDEHFQPRPGTERTFACDTILLAVGLEPVNEFTEKARQFGLTVLDAGDAEEIAEASAAIFAGKIKGRQIARRLGITDEPIPESWARTAAILKSHPGEVKSEEIPAAEEGVFPVFHCAQEIPCNPCSTVCPVDLIHIPPDDIRKTPEYSGFEGEKSCLGCERCLTICPGLAITLVDYRRDAEYPTVSLAYEFLNESVAVGDRVTVLDTDGHKLGQVEVSQVRAIQRNDRTLVVKVQAPRAYAKQIAGLRVQAPEVTAALSESSARLTDDEIVCRCERVTAGEIRELIRQGSRDINEIKAVTRAGMGACGGKTCASLIKRLFRQEGIELDKVEENTKRPLFVEVPLGIFAGSQKTDPQKGS